MTDEVKARLLSSLAAGRLSILVGAGLSMSPPSSVPGAEALARQTAEKYRLETGEDVPPGAEGDLEAQVTFFLSKNLFPHFVRHLVDWRPFTRDSNDGHRAVADLLGCRAAAVGVTTNFDDLIEQQAHDLGENKPHSSLNAEEAATDQPHAPLVKIHGCLARVPLETIWTTEQLSDLKTKERIDKLALWLAANLLEKDLVFVGFWSDWSYLQAALKSCISEVSPPLVILVSPDDDGVLEMKAPELWTWAQRCTEFKHVKEDGAAFLDSLRRAFGERFQEQLLRKGEEHAREIDPGLPSTIQIPTGRSSEELFEIRRDAEGSPPGVMPRMRTPSDQMAAVGAAHMILVGHGATVLGPLYVIGEKRLRVVQGAGNSLASVMKRYRGKAFPPESLDVAVCAGASDLGTPPDIVRPSEAPSVVRPGNDAKWVTMAGLMEVVGS